VCRQALLVHAAESRLESKLGLFLSPFVDVCVGCVGARGRRDRTNAEGQDQRLLERQDQRLWRVRTNVCWRDRTNVCWSSARTPATSEQAPDHARAHAHAHRHVQTHLHTRVQKCQRARAQARRRKQANSRTLGRTHGRTRGMARGRTLGRKLESTRALDRARQHSSTKLPANATALEALTHREGGGRAGELARAIATRHAESALRVVCIAGPTASGKTTFSHKLALALRAQGLCACVRARETQRY
jgi:hypothetical protein